MPSSVPILGLLGGIASGKSFWSRQFAAEGCFVVDADALVAEIYRRPKVLEALRGWWGQTVVNAEGALNRSAVARIIFALPDERRRLEALIHPLVSELRERETAGALARRPPPRAIVWDIPLLHEVGLAPLCDALIFVDAPLAVRQARASKRGWSAAELAKRESAQTPVEAKRAMADFILASDISEVGEPTSSESEVTARGAVRRLLEKVATLERNP